jgi:pantetheine-phosphate adenylyltransferase
MKRAIYPGSFDPLTYGHLDLIRRTSRIFDRLTVAIARNPGKSPLFSPEERVDMIQELIRDLPNVDVVQFDGMTVEFARQKGCTVIVRGVRSMADFEYESQLAFTNKALAPEIETLLMISSHEYALVSSRWIKEAALFGGNVSSFVPHVIAQRLRDKLMAEGKGTGGSRG